LRQNEIAGAVENSANGADAMGSETLAQCLDDGNAAGGGGFEFECHASALGAFGEIGTVAGQQRLVGAEYVFARVQRGTNEIERNAVVAADQFDNNIRVRTREVERV